MVAGRTGKRLRVGDDKLFAAFMPCLLMSVRFGTSHLLTLHRHLRPSIGPLRPPFVGIPAPNGGWMSCLCGCSNLSRCQTWPMPYLQNPQTCSRAVLGLTQSSSLLLTDRCDGSHWSSSILFYFFQPIFLFDRLICPRIFPTCLFAAVLHSTASMVGPSTRERAVLATNGPMFTPASIL
jgi:hypothetical protein